MAARAWNHAGAASLAALVLAAAAPPGAQSPWKRRSIDGSSRGADGTRLADLDRDGLLDIATAWEEGGAVRAYYKFDLVEVIDLDADGDGDVLTSEEADGLGVIWYENPAAADKPGEKSGPAR